MNRLLQIEWLKLKHYRPFWILIGLYGILVTLICSSARLFFQYLKNQGADIKGFDPTIFPFYDFPDVWQNITYIATYFKLFLAFIVIISVANEVNFRTMRQHIIDGMSKRDWLISKLLFLASLSIGATALLFAIGGVMGLLYSHPDGLRYIFHSTSFLFAYALEVFTFLTFALMITLFIRKAGFVIVGLMMYTLAFEPFLAVFLMYCPDFIQARYPVITSYFEPIAHFLPIRALNNLIHMPYLRYALREVQDYVSFREVIIVLGWLCVNIGTSYWILRKRDL